MSTTASRTTSPVAGSRSASPNTAVGATATRLSRAYMERRPGFPRAPLFMEALSALSRAPLVEIQPRSASGYPSPGRIQRPLLTSPHGGEGLLSYTFAASERAVDGPVRAEHGRQLPAARNDRARDVQPLRPRPSETARIPGRRRHRGLPRLPAGSSRRRGRDPLSRRRAPVPAEGPRGLPPVPLHRRGGVR